MAASLNKVMLIGHLGRDPESRNFQNGGSVVNFRLATSKRWKDRNNEWQEQTTWHQVCIFNEPLGKVALDYARKGSCVLVEGELQCRTYEKDGREVQAWEVVVPKFGGMFLLMDKRESGGGSQQQSGRSRPEADTRQREPQRRPAPATGGGWDGDDDIPF